jgi:ATP-dependent DNA ligase
VREFHNKARTGKTRVWRIEVQGDQVITEYGELGGKMQRTTDTALAKNVGRSNEVSAEEAAVQQMERTILLKTRKGYREVGEEERENEIDFYDLPENLCFYKPDNSLSKTLLKMVEDGTCWFARKRDGEMMVIVLTDDQPEIYSRRMLKSHHLEPDKTWADRFGHILLELDERYPDIPPGTILLGEMVAGPEVDNRWHVASCLKTKTEEAIRRQQEDGPLHFYCWDIAFWEEEDWASTMTVGDRYAAIHSLFKKGEFIRPVDWLEIDEIEDGLVSFWESVEGTPEAHEWAGEFDKADGNNREKAMLYSKILDWEGWVVVDPNGVFGDRAYNFRGKPDRPGKFSGKLKPEFEDDFIALWDPDNTEGLGEYGKWGRGKRQGQVGSVELYQYDSRGNMVYICDCGGGIIKTDDFAENFSDPELYPMVLKVLYTSRTYTSDGEKTNALQFPRVVEIRTDKDADECINERL